MRSDLPPPRLVPIPEAPVIQPPVVSRTTAPAEERTARLQRAAAAPPPATPAESKESKPVLGNVEMRPTLAAAPVPPSPPRQPHSRWEKPAPVHEPSRAASRFAPPRDAPPSAFDDEEDVDPFAEGGLFAAGPDMDADEELHLDALTDAEAPFLEGDDDDLGPFADDPFEPAPRRRGPSRTLLLVGGVLVVALVGGVAFAMLRPAGTVDGVPPVITADNAPTKITPEEPAAPADAQNKLIYDRVNSAAENTDTTLVTPNDGPIAPVTDDVADNPISRIIIPGGPGYDAPAPDDGAGNDDLAALSRQSTDDGSIGGTADDLTQPIGPRKVRTMVVKPDGTVVSTQVSEEGAPPPLPPADEAPTPVTDDTPAIAGTAGSELAITPTPTPVQRNGAADTTADTATPALDITPNPPPAVTLTDPPAAAPRAVASADQGAPLDLTQGGGASTAATAAVSGGMLVQISSQRSEEAARASYRDLQRRYPNILGPFDVNIQRADVPDRGTFFRARVGPFSPSDAQRLCDDLKSAGGDCVLASR